MKFNAAFLLILIMVSTLPAMAEVTSVLHTSQVGNVLESTFLRSDGIGSFSTMGGSQSRRMFRVKKRKIREFWKKLELLNLEDYRVDNGPNDAVMEAKTNHLIMIEAKPEEGMEDSTSYSIPKEDVPEDVQKWLDLLYVYART